MKKIIYIREKGRQKKEYAKLLPGQTFTEWVAANYETLLDCGGNLAEQSLMAK